MSDTRHQHDVQSVTSAPEARTADQARRLKQYLFTMTLRTICFVLLVVVDAWYRWIFAVGAVFLPFVAVVAANAVMPRVAGRVRPVVPVVDTTPQLAQQPFEPYDPDAHDGGGSATDR